MCRKNSMIYLRAYQFIKDLSVLINLPLGFEKRRHLTRKIVASDVSDKIANDSILDHWKFNIQKLFQISISLNIKYVVFGNEYHMQVIVRN